MKDLCECKDTRNIAQGTTGPCHTHAVCLRQVIDNRTGDTDIEYTYTTTESQTAVREVTVTNAISVAMEAEFKAFDVGVKVSATYEHTNVRQRPVALAVNKPWF